jgi:hypothetical protein
MLLIELFEDISTNASVKVIADILTTELPSLYRRLSSLAENFARNHGELGKGFNFVSGGPKSEWYKTVFFTNFRPALYTYAKSLPPQHRKLLDSFLSQTVGTGSFNSVQDYLIDFLHNVGNATGNKKIEAAALAAKHARDAYEKLCNKLDSGDPEDSGFGEPPAPKTPSAIGGQNATADALVSSVLAGLDRQVAGEIRTAIARSDNKIQALQAELRRRGIQL